jgi:hypothetical protein
VILAVLEETVAVVINAQAKVVAVDAVVINVVAAEMVVVAVDAVDVMTSHKMNLNQKLLTLLVSHV